MNKLKTFDCGCFIGRSHFGEDGTKNYLVFQPMHRYFKMITNTDYISSLNYYSTKTRVKFTGISLKQSKISYTLGKVVNIYIVYELGASSSHINDPTLKNWLFGAVTITKNADFDKYGYSGYGIGFDRRGSFSFLGGGYGQNVLIFGVDMSFSAHIDNEKKTY